MTAMERINTKRQAARRFRTRILTVGILAGSIAIIAPAAASATRTTAAQTAAVETTSSNAPETTQEARREVFPEKAIKSIPRPENTVYGAAGASGEATETEAGDTEVSETAETREFGAGDAYLLAKIAMAEAEDESTECKALVMLTVLNRVSSPEFPDSISDVIYEPKQFTPIENGRWDRVEPNDDCYDALSLVKSGWDESRGATYFEMTTDHPTWHSRSLEWLFEINGTSFYREG